MHPRISTRGPVGPFGHQSVRPPITPVQKPRFLAVFGLGEILYWIKWSTNMFWESPLLLSRFICQFVHLSLHSCHMFNTRRDTVRTHRCPVELFCRWSTNDYRDKNLNRALKEIDQAVKQKTYPRQKPYNAITIDITNVIGYVFQHNTACA